MCPIILDKLFFFNVNLVRWLTGQLYGRDTVHGNLVKNASVKNANSRSLLLAVIEMLIQSKETFEKCFCYRSFIIDIQSNRSLLQRYMKLPHLNANM